MKSAFKLRQSKENTCFRVSFNLLKFRCVSSGRRAWLINRFKSMKKILIIDDDRELCRLLSDYLEEEDFQCLCVHDGQTGLERASEASAGWDLIILDIMLPIKNGFEVLSGLRGIGRGLPVIMLTAKGDSVDKIVGLEMGADDYLGKPFNPRELLARIRSVLRRASDESAPAEKDQPDQSQAADFVLDEKSFCAAYQGRDLNLTPAEFKLLRLLVGQIGLIVPRDVLYREVLGRHEHMYDRSLDMHISRLRKKIWPEASGAERLKSIRGEGYLLAPERSR